MKWRQVRTVILSLAVGFSLSRLPLWSVDATFPCLLASPLIGVFVMALDQIEIDACKPRRRRGSEVQPNAKNAKYFYDLHSITP